MNRLGERLAELDVASDTLRADAVLPLAVEALSEAAGHGFVLAFLRDPDGSSAPVAAFDGTRLGSGELGSAPPPHWIVDIDAVPQWQRQRWVEPLSEGVHGPDYFNASHPISSRLGWRTPDYGRVMVCRGARLVAWAGVFVERAFSETERRRLELAAGRLARPLALAAMDQALRRMRHLSPRQEAILQRVAQGWSNKQIARELEIAPSTVKTFLERLYRISGAANRTALTAWWRGD